MSTKSNNRIMISFCIPAHDEEQLLPGTLAAIDDAARALSLDFEIVVADDGSTDGTADAAGAREAPASYVPGSWSPLLSI